jgi:hypothetical protein
VGEFAVTGPGDVGFQGQHDVHLLSDGSLVLLDNGFPKEQTARALRYDLDEAGRTLTLLEAWDTGLECPVLGGVRELPGGDLLVTCDTSGTLFEFAPGTPEPVWVGQVRCDSAFAPLVPRAIPVRR